MFIVLWILKVLWVVLSETINILKKFPKKQSPSQQNKTKSFDRVMHSKTQYGMVPDCPWHGRMGPDNFFFFFFFGGGGGAHTYFPIEKSPENLARGGGGVFVHFFCLFTHPKLYTIILFQHWGRGTRAPTSYIGQNILSRGEKGFARIWCISKIGGGGTVPRGFCPHLIVAYGLWIYFFNSRDRSLKSRGGSRIFI